MDDLGLAILSSAKNFTQFWSIGETQTPVSDITQNYLSEQKVIPGRPAEFRFYSCWEKTDERFAKRSEFMGFLHDQAAAFSNPVLIDY